MEIYRKRNNRSTGGQEVPIYEFLRGECGPFEERRSLEEAGNLTVCPECKTAARRVYHMPNLKTVPAALSNAMHRAEKRAHEPAAARGERVARQAVRTRGAL